MKPHVAVVQGKLARYPSFEVSLDKMLEHTLRATGWLAPVSRHIGLNPAEGRNWAVSDFLATDCDCLLFVDDDQVLHADALIRLTALLERTDYGAVAPLVLKVEAPFQAVAWHRVEGRLTPFIPWGANGVNDVDEIGTGVLMVRRAVFEALERPWFRLGQINPVQMMEDSFFARAMRAAGFRIGLDVDHQAGHVAPFTVWPDVANGCVALADQRGHVLAIPADALGRVPAPQPAAAGL